MGIMERRYRSSSMSAITLGGILRRNKLSLITTTTQDFSVHVSTVSTSTATNVITSPRDPTVTIGCSNGPRNLIRVLVKLQLMERPSLVAAGHLIGRNGGIAIVKDGI